MSMFRHRVLALGVAVLATAPMAAFAQSTSLTVSLPTDVTAAAGSEFSMPLTVSDGKGISAFFLDVSFDPTKTEFVKYEAGPATKDFGFQSSPVDGQDGEKILIFGASSDKAIDASGPTVLATLTFSVKSTASGELTYKLSENTDGIADATLVDGKVRIGAAGTVTSTPPTSAAVSSAPASSAPAVSATPNNVNLGNGAVSASPSGVELGNGAVSASPSGVELGAGDASDSPSEMGGDVDDAAGATVSEVDGPDALNQTGPIETFALILLSLGLAFGLQRLRRTA